MPYRSIDWLNTIAKISIWRLIRFKRRSSLVESSFTESDDDDIGAPVSDSVLLVFLKSSMDFPCIPGSDLQMQSKSPCAISFSTSSFCFLMKLKKLTNSVNCLSQNGPFSIRFAFTTSLASRSTPIPSSFFDICESIWDFPTLWYEL